MKLWESCYHKKLRALVSIQIFSKEFNITMQLTLLIEWKTNSHVVWSTLWMQHLPKSSNHNNLWQSSNPSSQSRSIYLYKNTIVKQLEYNQNTIFNNKSLGSQEHFPSSWLYHPEKPESYVIWNSVVLLCKTILTKYFSSCIRP